MRTAPGKDAAAAAAIALALALSARGTLSRVRGRRCGRTRRDELADNARRWASAVSAIVMLNLNANEGTIE